MKRTFLACALLCGGAIAFAQQPAEVPRHKCEPAPKAPGSMMRQDPNTVRMFDRELKRYKECITSYVDERNATIKAHEKAANAAIDEYNGIMRGLQEAQGKSGESGKDAQPAVKSPGYQ